MFLALCGCSISKETANTTADFTNYRNAVKFNREGESVELSSYRISFQIKDSSAKSEIEKILLDPKYVIPKVYPDDPDFQVTTTAKAKGSAQEVEVTAICYLNSNKTMANCQIEDDGGRYQILIGSGGRSLASAKLVLRIAKIQGYDGFVIGRGYSEPDSSIMVRLRTGRRVEIPLRIGF